MMRKKLADMLPALGFLLCVPSGAALLAKVFGLAEMHLTVPLLVVPSCAGLLMLWVVARRASDVGLATELRRGLVGGLLGLAAYDLYRWPFALAGYRVFVPIQVYGVWTLDASASSGWSDVCGIAYHVSNSLTFSTAYFLACRVSGKRHWGFAMCYALGLETVAVLTPFARIFHLMGNVPALLIAYSGHVAWGLPLAWMTARRDVADRFLSKMIPLSYGRLLITGAALLLACGAKSANYLPAGRPRAVEIQSGRVMPALVRLARGESLSIRNAGGRTAELSLQGQAGVLTVGGGQAISVTLNDAGIFQLKVDSDPWISSGFVIVEPVAEARDEAVAP